MVRRKPNILPGSKSYEPDKNHMHKQIMLGWERHRELMQVSLPNWLNFSLWSLTSMLIPFRHLSSQCVFLWNAAWVWSHVCHVQIKQFVFSRMSEYIPCLYLIIISGIPPWVLGRILHSAPKIEKATHHCCQLKDHLHDLCFTYLIDIMIVPELSLS